MFKLPSYVFRIFRVLTALALTLVGVTAARAAEPAGNILTDFLAAEWSYTMEQNPEYASDLGDHRFDDRWQDVSLPAIAARNAHARDALKRLQTIERAALTPEEQINFDLYARLLNSDIEEDQFRFYLCPVTQQNGVQAADELIESLRFSTRQDDENWCARLEKLPALIEQNIALMRAGIKANIVLPRIIMERVPAQVAKQIVEKAETSPFFAPLRSLPDSLTDEEKKALTERALAAIQTGIVPAYARLQKFLTEEYLPACYAGVGLWQMPAGAAAYSFYARQHTTTNLTPEQIHQIGLDEVARIHSGLEAVQTRLGFQGSLAEFFHYLRTDPKFFYRSPNELLNAYKVQAKSIDPLLPKLFKPLPRLTYGVEPIPAPMAPDATTAFYRPGAADGSRAGMFCVNLYKPETRPKWEMAALALHESVPGHHLQIALAQELGTLPEFRRNGVSNYTAYTEGWALYAEFLGEELGSYNNPEAKVGQLTYEMWRAVRLVVDTGIHYYHWDRQRAIDYFTANAPKTELDITNEVDRYIATPGQALAYKIGQLKIKELRARATAKLGPKFDIREFHNAVLGGGALPLDVLEHRIDAWIAQRQAQD